MKNRYGGPLRKFVSEAFCLKVYVDMYNTSAFHSNVTAYPAITVISKEKDGRTQVAQQPAIQKEVLSELSLVLRGRQKQATNGRVRQLESVVAGAEPWVLDSPDELSLVRRLEADFPLIEEVGCKVGIGVATGADKAFIAHFEDLDVEPDRKLPLVMTRDILTGVVKWRGKGIVNPFAADGSLVDLNKYPRLKRYLEARRQQIAGRHVAKKAPANWYRTIDRIYPAARTDAEAADS